MHFESYHQPDVVWHLPRCSSRKEQLEASSRAAWLQNCTEVFTFTEHLEPHTASDGTLYSSLVFWIRSAFRTGFSLHLLSLFCSHKQDYTASIWLSLASKAPPYVDNFDVFVSCPLQGCSSDFLCSNMFSLKCHRKASYQI